MIFPFRRRPGRAGTVSTPTRTLLGVQLLEDRTTPVGNVTLSVVGGDMILTGDGAAGGNWVSVTETAANRFSVTGLAGTTVNSVASVDTLALGSVNRDVKVNFTGAKNQLNFAGLGPTPTALRDFSFNLSKGGDSVSILGTFGRNVTIKSPVNSTGNDTVSITAGGGGIVGGFSGKLSIDGQGGTDTDTLTMAVAGNVSITSKDGGEHVAFNSCAIGGAVSLSDTAGAAGNAISFLPNTQISKNVTITNPGNFVSTVSMLLTQIGGAVSITNGSAGGPASSVTVTSSTIGQSLTVNGGDGSDSCTIDESVVVKAVSVNLKAGTNTVIIQNGSQLGSNVTLSAGNGDDTLIFSTDNEATGNIQANFGGGKNSFTFFNSQVLGNVSLTGGSELDTAMLNDFKMGKNLTINAGAGANFISITNESFVGGNASITNLAGVSSVTAAVGANVVTGNLSISYSSGGGTTSLSDFHVGGNASISNGVGGSTTTLSSFDAAGNLTVTGGSGGAPDTLTLNGVNIYRNAVFSTGGGNSTLALMNDSHILGNLTASHLGGLDVFDTHTGQSSVHGSVTINNGSGDSAANLNGFTVNGNLAITNGTGNDTIVADDVGTLESFGGNVTINNGAGNSTVRLAGKSSTERTRIGGNLTINGGSGIDSILLNALEVGGSTNVATGSNNDTVSENDSTFTGNAKFDLGPDSDTLQLDADPLQLRRTEFLASLTMNLGSGLDTLTVAGDIPATIVLVYGTLNGDFETAAEASTIGDNAVHVGFPSFA